MKKATGWTNGPRMCDVSRNGSAKTTSRHKSSRETKPPFSSEGPNMKELTKLSRVNPHHQPYCRHCNHATETVELLLLNLNHMRKEPLPTFPNTFHCSFWGNKLALSLIILNNELAICFSTCYTSLFDKFTGCLILPPLLTLSGSNHDIGCNYKQVHCVVFNTKMIKEKK